MIPYILMGIGGILILIALVLLIMYILEPVYKNFQIVIRRRDDYSHYTSPKNFAMLQKARRDYLRAVTVLFIAGSGLFFTGHHLKFGQRGLNGLSQEPYVSASGETFDLCLVVHGREISCGNRAFENADEVGAFLDETAPDRNVKVYLRDDFAVSSVYHELMGLLGDRGFEYDHD